MSGGEVSNVFIFRKKNNEAFKVPLQGKYRQDVQSEELKKRYVAG